MGVTSEVAIMNSALIKLGAERIISPDDANNRARLCKEQYPKVRDELIRSHPWNFAISFISLAAISPTPSDIFGYTTVFQLPTNCLRVLETDLGFDDQWEEIEGRRIAANVSTLKVKYIKKVVDVTSYDDNFCETLAWALAADIAYALTQSQAAVEGAVKNFEAKLKVTRSFDAQVGSVRRVVADDWLTSRRY